jgi:hypothetical protein
MVEAVNAGSGGRQVARQFGVSRPTVSRWGARAAGRRLERGAWSERPSAPHCVHRTLPAVDAQVLARRRDWRETSALGAYGAPAIHRAWPVESSGPPPVRTLGRILARRGARDGQARVRRPAPPRGWYVPAVAQGPADCACCDVVEGLVWRGGPAVAGRPALAVHAGLPETWPTTGITTGRVLPALESRWRARGLPAVAQVDNDTCCQGPHHFPDGGGRVARLCLQLGSVPVRAPLQDPSFQAALESLNGRGQAKGGHRVPHSSFGGLAERSGASIAAARSRGSTRAADAPPRRPFPGEWEFEPRRPPGGCRRSLRRTTGGGAVTLLGHTVLVDRHGAHRLIRAEVTLPAGPLRFFRLRRRDPGNQPLLREVDYILPECRRSLTGWH